MHSSTPQPESAQCSPLAVSASVVDAALDKFAALLADADYVQELEILKVGRMHFLRRRQMITELTGLYMALWRLALGRSFPQDADRMFEMFLERYGRENPGRRSAHVLERAREYWSMLAPQGDADFSPVARHLTSFSTRDAAHAKSMDLKLVLHIRKFYNLIFERLI